MRAGESMPGDQAEITFTDAFYDYLEGLTTHEAESVLADVNRLCDNPAGKHPLSNKTKTDRLAGLNTLDVLGGDHRVVFQSRIENGVGSISVLCAGPRANNAIYAAANDLIRTGHLTELEATQIWEALTLLDVHAEAIGLDGWDYAPEPASVGLRKSAVAAGLIDNAHADVMSKDEILAAMESGYDSSGQPNMALALDAAMRRARANAPAHPSGTISERREPRCGAFMARAGALCVRRKNHPGAHRAR